MSLFPQAIRINGVLYDIATLKNNDSDIADFLRQWYDDRDFISVHTSGSTGKPKAIRLQKTFVAASARRTINYFNLRENDRVLLCLPLHYIAGKLMLVRALLGGLDLCTIDPSTDFADLSSDKPYKLAAMVVNQVDKLLASPQSFAAIETLLIGGSALPPAMENKLQAVEARCYLSYGMTETATHIALRAVNGDEGSDYYHCLDGISVSLKNACLAINMPTMPTLITNDIAEVASPTTFKILGRADNVIVSGGIKFIPESIEAKISPYIDKPFFITAENDAVLGQKIVIVIESQADPSSEQKLHDIFSKYLSRYERPKAVFFQAKLKRTANGKIVRSPVF